MDNGGYIPAHPLAAQQAALVERLQLLLAMLHPELRPDVLLALQAPGKLLSNPSKRMAIPKHRRLKLMLPSCLPGSGRC